MPLTCVPRQVSSISFPVPLDKGNLGNEVSGFRGKRNRLPFCFLLDISLIFPLMWFFLHFTPSLHFTFSLQSALIFTPGPETAVRSPQSSFYSDRYSDIWCDRMFWYLPIVFSDCLPEWFQSKIGMFFDFREWSTIFHNFVSYCSVLLLCS